MKRACLPILFFLFFIPLYAEISFQNPDINTKNEFLFSVQAEVPGQKSYQTLFKKSLDDKSLEQLTFYPEALESPGDGAILQIRNRFGTGRYDTTTDTFYWVNDSKPFYAGGTVSLGMLPQVSTSPDGRWLVSIEAVSPARGRLILYDTKKDVRCVLANSVERGAISVSWAPDASLLLYVLDDVLYFARPESLFTVSSIDNRFRAIGSGSIHSVSWLSSDRFIYVSGNSVYTVLSSELIARSLYSQLIGVGTLAGKLPCTFNAETDSICASPDGNAVLYAKDGRNIYYCPLSGDDYVSASLPSFLPYLLLPGNTATVSLLWTTEGLPVVLSESVEDGKKMMRAWTLSDIQDSKVFTPLTIPADAQSTSLSRDKSLLAFITERGISVYDTKTWKEVASFRDEKVVSIAWGENSLLYIGGTETIRKWNCLTSNSTLLLLSSVSAYGWDGQGLLPLCETKGLGRFSYAGKGKWLPSATGRFRPASNVNASWRIYTDTGSNYYANMLFIRSATTPGGTVPLISDPAIKLDPFVTDSKKNEDSGSDQSVFSHGSRTGFRQVALVFDAMDSLDGLPKILHVLSRYKIRATFFINGEFIRRHPAAVNEIVKAGHQTASLFFSTWNMSNSQYRIDEDFIVRGLSRNEDDFYDATGQELTLLWHAPYYVSSPLILSAGKKAGYRYVASDIMVPDWVSLKQADLMPGLYRSAADMIEDIIREKKPGSIIPVRIGKVEGGRKDYLYEKIDLLINALVEAGYEIVPVDTLIKNAR